MGKNKVKSSKGKKDARISKNFESKEEGRKVKGKGVLKGSKGFESKTIGKNKRYKSRTVNMTPFLLKGLFIYVCMYCVYSMVFLFTWNILPYTFGYTFYVVDRDYVEYSVDKGNILLVKEVNVSENEEELQLHRIGKDYEITKNIRRPYGIIVSLDVVEDLVNIFSKLKSIFILWSERCLKWIPFSL